MQSSSSSQALVTSLLLPRFTTLAFPSVEEFKNKSPNFILTTFQEYFVAPLLKKAKKTGVTLEGYPEYVLAVAEYLVEEANFHDVEEKLLPLIKTVADEFNECILKKSLADTLLIAAIQMAVRLNDKCALYFFDDTMKYFQESLSLQMVHSNVSYPGMIALLTAFITSLEKLHDYAQDHSGALAEIIAANNQVTLFIEMMVTLKKYSVVMKDMRVMICFCSDLILSVLDEFDLKLALKHYDILLDNFEDDNFYDEYFKRIRNSSGSDELYDDENEDVKESAISLLPPKKLVLKEVHQLSLNHAAVNVAAQDTRQLLIQLYRASIEVCLRKSKPELAMSFLKDVMVLDTEKNEPLDMFQLAKLMETIAGQIVTKFDPANFDSFYLAVSTYVDIFAHGYKVITSYTPANAAFVHAALTGFNQLIQLDFTGYKESFKFPFFYPQCRIIEELRKSNDRIFNWNDFPEIKSIKSNRTTFKATINGLLKEIAPREQIKYDQQYPKTLGLLRRERYTKHFTVKFGGDDVAENNLVRSSSTLNLDNIKPPESRTASPKAKAVVQNTFLQKCLNLAFTNIYNMQIILDSASLSPTVKRYALLYNIFEAYKALNHASENEQLGFKRDHGDKHLDNIKKFVVYGGPEIASADEITSLCQLLVSKLPTTVTKTPSAKPVPYRVFKETERKDLLSAFDTKHETVENVSKSYLYDRLHNFNTEFKVEKISQEKIKSKMQDIITVKIPEISQAIGTRLEEAEDNLETAYLCTTFFESQALKVLMFIYGYNSFHYKLIEPAALKSLDQMCFKLIDSFSLQIFDTTIVSFENYMSLFEIFDRAEKEEIMLKNKEPEESKEEQVPTAPRMS